ncbi:MAG: glycosyltransferase family 9 protein [Ferruginibacter sp.]
MKTGFQRYADVFAALDFPVELNIEKGIQHFGAGQTLAFPKKQNVIWVGIAPFAKHAAKMYPLDKMAEVKDILIKQPGIQILVFASRDEAGILSTWEKESDRIIITAGKTDFKAELQLISALDVMISMDSANMHLASLAGVPVISVWGGTHPFLGFYGWGQDIKNAVQTDLPCRPSSVFGNKECPVHGAAGCMQEITPQMIAGRSLEVLKITH